MRLIFFFLNGGFGGEYRLRKKIVEYINPQEGERIVDICCGTGSQSIMLAKRFKEEGKVVGLELSSAQLRVAKKKERPNCLYFIRCDAQSMPLSNCYFDKGIICSALHEMPKDVRKNVLSETFRVIKPGGKIVIAEPNRPNKKWKVLLFEAIDRFTPEYPTYKDLLQCRLVNEIKEAGFRVIRTEIAAFELLQIVLSEKES
jgi:demethylmenaquinone methyltransferase/2-methoxy-6-polyprenyl-1,4-benzoquinol methylase